MACAACSWGRGQFTADTVAPAYKGGRNTAKPMAPLATSWALDAAALGQGGAVCHRASRGDRPSQPPPLPSAPRAAALPRPACARGRGKGRGGHSQAWTHVLCAAHSEQQGAVTSPLRAPGGPGGRPESLAKQGQQYRAHDGVLYIRNFFEQTQVSESALAKSAPACAFEAPH